MYAIYVMEDGRIGCATYPKYASTFEADIPDDIKEEDISYTQEDMRDGYILVDALPEGILTDYRYENGEYVYDPLPAETEEPTQLDMIEAQVTYTAMMTDTLLEV